MVIDRVEGDIAVVELAVGRHADIPIASIEGRARDGAVIVRATDGRLHVDEAETEKRKSRAKQKAKRLFK